MFRLKEGNTSRHRKAGEHRSRVAAPMGQTFQMLLRAGTDKKITSRRLESEL